MSYWISSCRMRWAPKEQNTRNFARSRILPYNIPRRSSFELKFPSSSGCNSVGLRSYVSLFEGYTWILLLRPPHQTSLHRRLVMVVTDFVLSEPKCVTLMCRMMKPAAPPLARHHTVVLVLHKRTPLPVSAFFSTSTKIPLFYIKLTSRPFRGQQKQLLQ